MSVQTLRAPVAHYCLLCHNIINFQQTRQTGAVFRIFVYFVFRTAISMFISVSALGILKLILNEADALKINLYTHMLFQMYVTYVDMSSSLLLKFLQLFLNIRTHTHKYIYMCVCVTLPTSCTIS